MKMSMKVILAAMGIAVLTSPVLAKNANRHAPKENNQTVPVVADCVHVAFPQCSGWRRTRHAHRALRVHAVRKSD